MTVLQSIFKGLVLIVNRRMLFGMGRTPFAVWRGSMSMISKARVERFALPQENAALGCENLVLLTSP